MPEYVATEANLQSVIYDRFGLGNLSIEELKKIEEVDDTLLYYEFEVLMDFLIFDNPPYLTVQHDFSQRDFASVEKEFLAIFFKCSGQQFKNA